ASGTLESGKDFARAAELLEKSPSPEDLLVAHLLTLAAAFRGQGDLKASAVSFDRYLLAIGQKQVFDTVKSPEQTPAEPRAPLPEVVLRGYGLSTPSAK